MQCDNGKKTPDVKVVSGLTYKEDSLARRQMEGFGIPYSRNLMADTALFVFFYSQPGDTSSLIEIRPEKDIIRGMYYEILPNFHHFVTDYKDTTSKLIFFEGYSFVLDSAQWRSLVGQANEIFEEKEKPNTGLKWTDASTYALYYGGQSRHGGPEGRASFEKLNNLLNDLFLNRYRGLRKPIFYKNK